MERGRKGGKKGRNKEMKKGRKKAGLAKPFKVML